MKKVVALLLVVLAGSFLYTRYGRNKASDRPTVNQAAVSTGTIVQAVRAVGTLQPIRMVRVGPQVSGTVKALNVDFNSVVRKDEVLAEIEPSLFEMQVAVQEANIARQDTDIARQRVQLGNLETNLQRAQAQYDKGLVSLQQLETATLQVKTLTSQIAAAEKTRVQAMAQLSQAKLNVSYCIIRSPVDGVVVNRFVDVGQVVQASYNSPMFFMIAEEMTTLRLSAGVDEADIGRIRPDMPVTFSVDSYRGQTFQGRVDAVRLNAQIHDSVVTYPVWIEVPNADLRLRPGMTANLQIIIDSAAGVTRLPVDALRFRPTPDMYSWLQLPAPPAGQPVRLAPPETVPVQPVRRPRADDEDQKIDDLFQPAPKRIMSGQVWVYDETNPDSGQRLRSVSVRTGLTDTAWAEVISGDLKPGQQLVTGIQPPPSVLEQRSGNIFQQPQRGFGGMTPAGEVPLPTLQRGGPRGGGGGRGRG